MGEGMTRGFYSVDSLKGVHVLVVDHEPDGRELLTSILHYCGALVTPVAAAEEALAVMKRVKPDIIVTELDLPGRDGQWIVRAVRALKPEDGGTVPVIALLARVPGRPRSGGTPGGFEGSVTRPINPWELCGLIANLTIQ